MFKDVNVGDVVVSCWGYSMTLYDFFEVMGKTAKSVKLRRLRKEWLGGDPSRMPVKPILQSYDGECFTRRVSKDGQYCQGPASGSGLIALSKMSEDVYYEDHMD